ncbi:MAG: hypothetical protein E4G96_05000 [Chrysiogenales bacterium]|nr:MAG: hypothetical protein E4G96_05000 [Chrysiogenales bacterium]
MKINLRLKLFLGIISLNFGVLSVLGFFMYSISSDRFFDQFLKHKLSIAQFLSSAIDGDIHEKMSTPESSARPEFMQYIRIMNAILKKEKDIRYFYTVNYDRKNNRLYYVLDSNIPEQDIMWFEVEHFAFYYFIDKKGRLTVEYDDTLHNKNFEIDTDIGIVTITLRNEPGKKQILIGSTPIFTVITVDPLSADTPIGISRRDDRVKSGPITINGTTMDCTITYSGKGEPSSYPGNDFIEKKEVIAKTIGILINKRDYVDREIVSNAFGSFITAYSPILNRRGEGIGVICVDVNAGKSPCSKGAS